MKNELVSKALTNGFNNFVQEGKNSFNASPAIFVVAVLGALSMSWLFIPMWIVVMVLIDAYYSYKELELAEELKSVPREEETTETTETVEPVQETKEPEEPEQK